MLESASDEKLLQMCLAGETAAWEEFVLRYDRLFRYVVTRRIAGAKGLYDEDADDIVGFVYRSFIENPAKTIGRYRGEVPLAEFLSVLASHRVTDYLRAHPRERPSPAPDLAEAVDGTTAEVDVELFRAALGRLPERESVPVQLRFYEGLKCKEIAEFLAVPAEEIPVLLHRARKRLEKLLPEERSEAPKHLKP